jgi:hypothetical protein
VNPEQQSQDAARQRPIISRRSFIEAGTRVGAAFVAAGAGLDAGLISQERVKGGEVGPVGSDRRREQAFEIRLEAARIYLDSDVAPAVTNGDEERYEDKRASFSKTLPHSDLGEVDPDAYATFVSILARGDPAQFERLPAAAEAEAKFNNPQATYAFEMVGVDSHATRLPPPPRFANAQMACEMAELYWLALTRDVPFLHFDDHPLIKAAVADLNGHTLPVCLGVDGTITPGTLFRGETPGEFIGPYVSQFLWLEIPYGIKKIDQRYTFPVRGQNFLTGYADWLACQRGQEPRRKILLDDQPRYVCSNRELAEYVHHDFSFQAYMNAALILLQFGEEALSPTNPYRGSRRQFGDITFGNKNVLSMLAQASLLGQKGSYYHKWLVHRRLRPEVFGGRLETCLSGKKSYDIHSDLLQCDAIARMRASSGTVLLPIAYPEGCPTHPSYPAAHAANAGACATVLRAFFDEGFTVPKPVQANAEGSALEPWQGESLTLGNEINKLASNIALGRDAAGVHYRSDSIQGLRVGEQQAIGLLADYSRTYNEHFDGFVLTKFDGAKVRIVNGEISVL